VDTISFLDSLIPEQPEKLAEEEAVPERILCESDKRARFEEEP
jgi:hypothetical protein